MELDTDGDGIPDYLDDDDDNDGIPDHLGNQICSLTESVTVFNENHGKKLLAHNAHCNAQDRVWDELYVHLSHFIFFLPDSVLYV